MIVLFNYILKGRVEFVMMKNLKKSEIIIYVVALMLVTAGYFNYTANDSNNLVETYSEDVQELENTSNAGVGDAVLVSNNEVEDNNENVEKKDKEDEQVALVENESESETNDNKTIEGASSINDKSVSTNSSVENTNYFANSKLEREKMYASMISTYQNILNNNNVSETQKSIASKEITKINNAKNSIMICENLIMTKGFDNCVILINEDSVNIVVNIKNGLTAEKVAQIQNIVSRELGTEVENIHIMEK